MTDDEYETEILHSVTRAAGLSIGGILSQRILLFLTNLVLTNSLGVGTYGLYALGSRITGMLRGFAHLGSNPTLVRFLPKYAADGDRQNRVLGAAYLTTAITSLTLATGLFVAAPLINDLTVAQGSFVRVLRLFALTLPLFAFVLQLGNVFRSVEEIEYQILILRFLRPGTQLLAVVAAVALGYSVFGIVTAIVLGLSVATATAVYLAWTRLPIKPALPRDVSELREFFGYALPNSLATLGAVMRSRIDVLLIGAFLTADAAGVYNIALFLTGFIALPLMSINQLFPPVASRLYSDGDIEALQATYSTATRWLVTAALAIGVYEFAFRDTLLGIFGSAYQQGEFVLVLFAIGQVVNASVGSAGWLLLMTDHQYLAAINNWILGVVNVGLSYVLILEYGLIGAALGTAGSLVLVNCLRVSELYYFEGVHPYDRAFLKPLGATATAVATSALVRWTLDGLAVLGVGAVVVVTTFMLVLGALGPEPADRDLLDVLRDRVGL